MSRFRGLPPYRIRRSEIHGTGVFATRRIRAGTRIIEYRGERISHDEADRRYASKPATDNHTFLFTVDARTVIDGGAAGNAARFLNHSCDPNCEAVVERRRVFIEAMRDIEVGAELVYDYMIERDPTDPPEISRIFGCRCRVWTCRGTMLLPARRAPEPLRLARRSSAPRAAGMAANPG